MTLDASAGNEMQLTVRYIGPDPDRGRMSAVEVGPAILGVGEMVGQASRIVYGDDTRLRVDVRADFAHASFGIEFFAVSAAGGLIPPLTLEQISALCSILGLTGIGAVKGVLALIRWQRGRKIDKVEKRGDEIHLTINDQSTNVTVNEYKIFVNPEVRKGFRALAAPLEREGVDSVEVRAGDAPPTRIEKAERKYFTDAPYPEEEIAVDKYTATLEIVSISFRETYKWRFAQGGNTFFAEILDKKFLADVARSHERFGAGDVLRCRMEVRTTRSAEGIGAEHKVIEVLEHIPGSRGGDQIALGE
jgi:hypothetical protein